MHAIDWFEQLRADVLDLVEVEKRCAKFADACMPHGMASEPSGRGSAQRRVMPEDLLVDSEQRRDVLRERLQPRLARACAVLYGRSGRGGVAHERGSGAADAIHGYYLQGMSWRQVSDELVRPESEDGPQWCRRAAARAMQYVDSVGMDFLANS